MRVVRLFMLAMLVMEAVAAEAAEVKEAADPEESRSSAGCALRNAYGQCTRSEAKLSRKKRLVTLPNRTSFVLQSRLIVPQPPVGLYLVWVRVRLFIRAMFTESLIST